MPQKNFFLAEGIEFSTEYHLSENIVKSQIIYSAIVLSIIADLFFAVINRSISIELH